MRAEICAHRKIRVQRRGAEFLLQERDVGGFPADEGDEELAGMVAPSWEPLFVCVESERISSDLDGSQGHLELTVIEAAETRVGGFFRRHRAGQGALGYGG